MGSCANFIIRDVTLDKTQDRSNDKLGLPVSIQFPPVLISARCRRFIKQSLIPHLQANNREIVRKFLPVDKVFATKSYFLNLMYFYLINVFQVFSPFV